MKVSYTKQQQKRKPCLVKQYFKKMAICDIFSSLSIRTRHKKYKKLVENKQMDKSVNSDISDHMAPAIPQGPLQSMHKDQSPFHLKD